MSWYILITRYAKAASSLENLKVKDSPIKKLDFNAVDKENIPAAADITLDYESQTEKQSVTEVKELVAQPKVPKTLKELEAEEPLLQENPHRFVLFPLKYHEIVSTLVDTLLDTTSFLLHLNSI